MGLTFSKVVTVLLTLRAKFVISSLPIAKPMPCRSYSVATLDPLSGLNFISFSLRVVVAVDCWPRTTVPGPDFLVSKTFIVSFQDLLALSHPASTPKHPCPRQDCSWFSPVLLGILGSGHSILQPCLPPLQLGFIPTLPIGSVISVSL